MAELTHAQLDVAAAFFALHESEGFVVVGGAAHITLELVDRLTEDLDFFVSIPGRVTLHPRRCVQPWNFEVGRWPSFVTPSRFNDSKLLAMNELVRVDLALDSAARLLTIRSPIGPTPAPTDRFS